MKTDDSSSPNPEKSEQQQSNRLPNGKFRPGFSGNPRSKPKGARHRSTMIAESILGKHARDLLEKAIYVALFDERGATTLRSLLPFVAAPLRERPLVFELPDLNQPGDAKRALDKIADGLAAGELTENQARVLVNLVDSYIGATKLVDLDERLKNLEAMLNAQHDAR